MDDVANTVLGWREGVGSRRLSARALAEGRRRIDLFRKRSCDTVRVGLLAIDTLDAGIRRLDLCRVGSGGSFHVPLAARSRGRRNWWEAKRTKLPITGARSSHRARLLRPARCTQFCAARIRIPDMATTDCPDKVCLGGALSSTYARVRKPPSCGRHQDGGVRRRGSGLAQGSGRQGETS